MTCPACSPNPGECFTRFTVPGKPVPWQRVGVKQKGLSALRFFTKPETVTYQRKVRQVAQLAGCYVFKRGVFVRLNIWFPDNAVRDDDNVEKSIRDALQMDLGANKLPIAFFDDHHVGGILRLVMPPDPVNPRAEVELRGTIYTPTEVNELVAKAMRERKKRQAISKAQGWSSRFGR